MDKLTVKEVDINGKRILVRVDFNVPLDYRTGEITDDSRIKATLPTIDYLTDNGAKVILCSHLGRPGGEFNKKLSLAVVAKSLSKMLRQTVDITSDCVGPEVEEKVATLKNGDVLLLENLRFHNEEENCDASFTKALAQLGDIFVNDAFGTSHRSHASIVGITRFLPAVSGLLLEKEVDALGSVLENPLRPFVVLLGGAKISDKVSMLNNIMGKVDSIIIGGGMAAIFLKAKSYNVGLSLLDDAVDIAADIIEKAAYNNVKLLLPEDVLIAEKISKRAMAKTVSVKDIPTNKRIVDIGALTISRFTKELEKCRTVFWNGPMGIYEIVRFREGTMAIATIIANLNATTIIGGGSTAEIVTEMKLNKKMTFVSTGGGASLRFLSGETLPGVDVLLDKNTIIKQVGKLEQ
ncbi:MAG: phosphoglycerate kinase [Dehalococcoidia bacterium]|nr:MAG: phosphoglycerate kinase [Dehalococcoidia bacterium]